MLKLKLPYVQERGDGYCYRRVIPPDVRDAFEGKANWFRTWRAGTPLAVVEREAKQLAAVHDRAIEAARIGKAEGVAQQIIRDRSSEWFLEFLEQGREDFGHDWRRDPQTAAIVRAIEGGGTIEETMTLTAALDRDLKVYSGDKDPRAFKYAVQSFVEACGDLDVTTITRRHVSDWLAVQRREGKSPATIKRRYGTLKAMVGRALLDLGSDKRNPLDGFRMTEGDGTKKRVPFNRAMLTLIESYVASGRVGSEVVELIRIMRGTGATIGEAGGLIAADVILDNAVPHLLIRPNRLRRLKTAARERPVPLVDDVALEAATSAVERAGKTGQLFPGFHLERGADLLSAKVVKAIRAAGVPRSKRLTAHSFRHTVAEALRVSGASFHLQRRLLGHASRDESDIYGANRARLEELAKALSDALPHLGDVDDANFSESERI